MPGPITKRLTPDEIQRLKYFQRRGDGRSSYSIMNLARALDAPFTWETLQRAMRGAPVQERTAEFIVAWLDRFVPRAPGQPAVLDTKQRAAGERPDPETQGDAEETPGTARTIRGSR